MLTRTLARWLYPGWCAVCKRLLHLTEDHLCRACFIKLARIRLPICRGCGVEIPPHTEKISRCNACRGKAITFDEIFAVFRYDDNFKQVLHQIKYERKYWLLETFKKKIKRTFQNQWPELPSFIVPVPLDKFRMKERTFNQSLIIAETISKILDIPIKKDILLRREHRSPQSWLTRRERLANLENLFQVRKRMKLKNCWVLVVDDVVTTGATVQECSKMLKEAGASKVSVFALARTPSLS
ncbi:MAG: ComF family protein [Candidatus Omnitrophica bacterium]|nr:ComF family protein [Candidatus Omnitrophota bacterium]